MKGIQEDKKNKDLNMKKYDTHTRLLNGEVLSADVTMFVSGKEAYMKDQEKEGRVNVFKRTKYLSLYETKISKPKKGEQGCVRIERSDKLKYNKGHI